MELNELRSQIVEFGASLFARGFTAGSSGNISVRSGNRVLMTPTNSSLGRLRAERLSLLNERWEHIAGDKPSKEVVMHRAMYSARPELGAIVHLHSAHVTALSCLVPPNGPLMTPHTPYFVMKMGVDLPLVPYFKPGDPAMEEVIFQAAKKSKVLVLANHGSLVGAASLVNAVDTAEELEVSAQLALLLHGRQTRPLNTQEIAELLL